MLRLVAMGMLSASIALALPARQMDTVNCPALTTYLNQNLGRNPLPAEIRAHNAQVLESLNAPLPSPQPGRQGPIHAATAEQIFKAVYEHPVAGMHALEKWDPNGTQGYCFGRAFAAHLEALFRHQIDQKHIRKIWAVGNLYRGPYQWSYHVATMVKAEGPEGWWVIDPVFHRPLTVAQWIDQMKRMDATATLFTSAANRLNVSAGDYYSKAMLYHYRWGDYFRKVVESYKSHAPKDPTTVIDEPTLQLEPAEAK